MMKTCISILVATLSVTVAHADEGEMQIAVAPGTTFLLRHGRTNVGFGGHARWSFGLADFFDIEGTLGCDYLASMEELGLVSSTGIEGSIIYDATRCLAVPAVAVRSGGRLVVSGALGVGYRFEVRSNREFGVEGVLLERPDMEVLHEMVAVSRVAAEYRVTPFWSFGVFAELTTVLAGAATELDFQAGLVVAGYFYP